MNKRPLLQKVMITLIALVVLGAWWNRYREARKRHQGTLAIVHISGMIRTSSSSPGWPASDAEGVAERLHRLSEDEDVKAIVLRINSPGGAIGAVQEIGREIGRCRAKGKKVVASLADVAASGGYYLAAVTDHIVANPGTLTGSIGVIAQFGNLEGLLQKVGVKFQVIKSGAHKDMGSPARALTPEERRMLQESIDDAYAQFVEAVRAGRRLSAEELNPLADGRIFTGRQALKEKLIDDLGDQQDAIQTAIRLAQLPEKPYILSDRKTPLSALFRHAASRSLASPLDSLQEAWPTGLEYRWLQ